MKRDYITPIYGGKDYVQDVLDCLQRLLGASDRLLHFEVINPSEPQGSFKAHCTIDWGTEWLEDRVQRLLKDLEATDGWSVTRSELFIDLKFPPLIAPEPGIPLTAHGPFPPYAFYAPWFYEHCDINGPERYGVVAQYWDTYRFYAGLIDMDAADDRTVLDVEDSLEVCVKRVAHHIRTGEGRQLNVTKRYPHLITK